MKKPTAGKTERKFVVGTFTIEPQLWTDCKNLCFKLDVPVSSWIRKAVRKQMANDKKGIRAGV